MDARSPEVLKNHNITIEPRIGLAVALLILVAVMCFTLDSAIAQTGQGADVRGTVIDSASGSSVGFAQISVEPLGLSTQTDSAGRFLFNDIDIAETFVYANISVTAPGYGEWIIQDVRLVTNDTLILNVELNDEPVTITVPRLPAERPALSESERGAAAPDPPLDDHSLLPIPTTIRVRVTGYAYCDLSRPYTVETVDFKDYVKHVLPNEWPSSWHTESLRAGAMAAKMYAWSYIAIGGKWPDADVYDSTCDQVYNPAVEYESTNNAVDATWDWRLMRGEHLFRTF